MALSLPLPDEAGGVVWPHDWHPYQDYVDVHHSHLRRLEDEGIVLEDGLSFVPSYEPRTGQLTSVRIFGRLLCQHGVSIQVDKTLAIGYVRDAPHVRGIDYNYHAWFASTEQDILRYDMAHGEGLHCHVFDFATGESALLPVPLDMLPTLDGFVRMACRRAADAARA